MSRYISQIVDQSIAEMEGLVGIVEKMSRGEPVTEEERKSCSILSDKICDVVASACVTAIEAQKKEIQILDDISAMFHKKVMVN
ncbi:MAG: hypothetical protein V1799_00535 [bacterium]